MDRHWKEYTNNFVSKIAVNRIKINELLCTIKHFIIFQEVCVHFEAKCDLNWIIKTLGIKKIK